MNGRSPCKCKKCNEIFDYEEMKLVDRDLYGFNIKESCCPKCGGEWIPLVPSPWLDKFLYINEDKKYYEY